MGHAFPSTHHMDYAKGWHWRGDGLLFLSALRYPLPSVRLRMCIRAACGLVPAYCLLGMRFASAHCLLGAGGGMSLGVDKYSVPASICLGIFVCFPLLYPNGSQTTAAAVGRAWCGAEPGDWTKG